jgi:chemotaxis protein CheD
MNANSPRRPIVAALSGFEHIARVWDSQHNIWLAKIHPGEACVTASTEGVTTVLGSCISACLRDTRTGVGGMNHFMLPDEDERHGVDAMERLVNAVLAHGCGERSHLELKLVGGSRLPAFAQSASAGSRRSLGGGGKPGTQDTAQRAVDFAHRFSATLRLAIAAEDVGGVQGREVVYWPGTGQLRIRKLRGIEKLVAEREREYALATSRAE